jgi:hypothetical protein
MAYSPQGEQGLTRAQVRPDSFTGDAKADKGLAQYFLSEMTKLLLEGKTPFVSPQDVEKEKDRRAQLGLDPDFRDDAVADLLAPQNTVGRQERIDNRLEQIRQRDLPPVQNPVVSEQMSPESQANWNETLRMLDVIENVPLKQEPELSAEDKAKEAFFARKNNPALRAGLDKDFLFARHKANLVSQLARQGLEPKDLEGTEQAFLADQLEKYTGNKRQFNSGRDRGF